MVKISTGKWRAAIFIFAGAFLLVFSLEIGLNWRLTAAIRRSFLQEPVSDSEAKVAVSWLGIQDIIRGKVNRVQINSRNCKLGKLRYQRLDIEGELITFDFPALLKEKRLRITRIQRARIKAAINETAFQEYLVSAYPEFEPRFSIVSTGIQLSGRATLFGNNLPVALEGRLGISGPKKLRFFPEKLVVAGRPVAPSFIQFISRQIPLEFSIMNEWPLEITGIRLDQGVLLISLKEFTG
ncbi:MAG: LmeA family phospholipid-binding protein [Firmicutes bacterium]|nr:LmeA family phospholipid-binding protein [Bacillota bacterium]